MTFFIFFLIFCLIVAVVAGVKGRSGFGWFIISFLISPLLSLIILLIIGDNKEDLPLVTEDQLLRNGSHRECPSCAEIVKAKAKVCKHCGVDLPEQEEKEIS